MQLKEILSIENNRTEETKCVIHLFQEGSFYRAYEWSAWLCHRFVQQFKVTHKNFKSIDQSVLFVGFPVMSLPKYVDHKAEVSDVDEKNKDVLFSSSVIPDDMDLDLMAADFEMWKSSIPVDLDARKSKEGADSQRANIEQNDVPTISKAGIVQQILAFPLENKTPLQCMCFIAELKQQVVSIM